MPLNIFRSKAPVKRYGAEGTAEDLASQTTTEPPPGDEKERTNQSGNASEDANGPPSPVESPSPSAVPSPTAVPATPQGVLRKSAQADAPPGAVNQDSAGEGDNSPPDGRGSGSRMGSPMGQGRSEKMVKVGSAETSEVESTASPRGGQRRESRVGRMGTFIAGMFRRGSTTATNEGPMSQDDDVQDVPLASPKSVASKQSKQLSLRRRSSVFSVFFRRNGDSNDEIVEVPALAHRRGAFKSVFLKRFMGEVNTLEREVVATELKGPYREPEELPPPLEKDLAAVERLQTLVLQHFATLGQAFEEFSVAGKITRTELMHMIGLWKLQHERGLERQSMSVQNAQAAGAIARKAQKPPEEDTSHMMDWNCVCAVLTRQLHLFFEDPLQRALTKEIFTDMPNITKKERSLRVLLEDLAIFDASRSFRLLSGLPVLKYKHGAHNLLERTTTALELMKDLEPRSLVNALLWEEMPKAPRAGLSRYAELVDEACNAEAIKTRPHECLELLVRVWNVLREVVAVAQRPELPTFVVGLGIRDDDKQPRLGRKTSKGGSSASLTGRRGLFQPVAGRNSFSSAPNNAEGGRTSFSGLQVKPSTAASARKSAMASAKLTEAQRRQKYCSAFWAAWHPRSLMFALGHGADHLPPQEFGRLIESAWKLMDELDAPRFLKHETGAARLKLQLQALLTEVLAPLDNIGESEQDRAKENEDLEKKFQEMHKALERLESVINAEPNLAYAAALYGALFLTEMAWHWVNEASARKKDDAEVWGELCRIRDGKVAVTAESIILKLTPMATEILGVQPTSGKRRLSRVPS
mmetsp:Transcript_55276/g.131816  ORF Transcript_55276/g.131816 Transcript_55276/m.131816 type:complete len:810 (-) Transcript_55276:166-2595(-)